MSLLLLDSTVNLYICERGSQRKRGRKRGTTVKVSRSKKISKIKK